MKVKGLSNPAPLKVVMEDEAVGVDEVVVVGYGVTATRDLTGQVASLNEEQLIRKKPQPMWRPCCRMRQPGLLFLWHHPIRMRKSEYGFVEKLLLSGDNEPLYVVDGMPV